MARSSTYDAWQANTRAFARDLVDTRFDGNVTAAARELGVSQAALHDFLQQKRGAGIGLLAALADYSAISFDHLVGHEVAEQPLEPAEARVRRPSDPDPEEIAARIRDYSKRTDNSLREMSRRAGLSPSGVQKIVDRLEKHAGDVGLDSLVGIAHAMGMTLIGLLHGDHPPGGVVLRSLPGWQEAAAVAVDRFAVEPRTVEAIGGWLVHAAPAHLDGIFVAALARAWSSGQG
jgi:transcriptional regulator with XRE-family HTH domain